MSNPAAPFYLGATIESLDLESTDQGWEVQPRPLSGPISHGRGGSGGGPGGRGYTSVGRQRGREGKDSGEKDEAGGQAGGAAFGRVSSGDGGGGPGPRVGDRLVKKRLRLNQLAVYWNPAEDGNPCSMHLSDIPVEQAEVVIGRQDRPGVGSLFVVVVVVVLFYVAPWGAQDTCLSPLLSVEICCKSPLSGLPVGFV